MYPSPSDIYPLSLHDALPICLTKLPEQLEALRLWDGSPLPPGLCQRVLRVYAHYTFLSEQIAAVEAERRTLQSRSEEHTSELQSLRHLVCRLLLEKKNKKITAARVVRVARPVVLEDIVEIVGDNAIKPRRYVASDFDCMVEQEVNEALDARAEQHC